MKPAIDFLQILITLPALRWIGCVLLVAAIAQALRLLRVSVSAFRAIVVTCVVPVWKIHFWVKCAVPGTLVFMFSAPLHGLLQELEYRLWQPVYVYQTATDGNRMAAYERILRKHTDSYEFSVVKRWTAETAAKINSTPLAIYETALLECGLNPFRVRDDRVAAGWIQFTDAGCRGLGVTKEQVISACQNRDIETIMRLTDAYLVRRWEQAGKPDMRNTIDLYLAVFAPAHIGRAPEQVVYKGYGNAAYYKNAGLDGWFQDGGKIVRKASECDGRITVWEIFLCLERKKGIALKQNK